MERKTLLDSFIRGEKLAKDSAIIDAIETEIIEILSKSIYSVKFTDPVIVKFDDASAKELSTGLGNLAQQLTDLAKSVKDIKDHLTAPPKPQKVGLPLPPAFRVVKRPRR